jgi:glycosyltransferase involved in cell wall biosynthesis
VKIALSILCENPSRRTGLSTTFEEFVARGAKLFPDVSWLVFAGPEQDFRASGANIQIDRSFQANDRMRQRLWADHVLVPAAARRQGADVLITTGFVPIRKALPVVMLVFSLQHLDPRNRIGFARGLYRKWLTKSSWPKADLVITNSKFAASQILSVYPDFRSRLVQSYEGLQHEQFNPVPLPDEAGRLQQQFNLQPGYFLWISNFYPYKQPGSLLKAYSLLPVEFRRLHPLVMSGGSWANELENCKGLARDYGIEQDVKFLGWVGDEWLAPLYRHALAFVLASREETFGRCVIESMACGTPCIVNDIPIMREVTAGHASVVDFQNAPAVAAALEEIAGNRKFREQLKTDGLARASDFTFEKFAAERVSAIQRFLQQNSARKSRE